MGHIPSAETTELDILSFQDALDKSQPICHMGEKDWIYYPNFYSDYRYVLGTVGQRPVVTIGINPSTAEPDKPDRTVSSVERHVLDNGFDSFIMFNVYAQRATKPTDMDQRFNLQLHQENMKALRWILENAYEQPVIWAAWGTNIGRRPYLADCLKDIVAIGKEFDARWVRIGALTKEGHPRHPLYLRNGLKFEDFAVDSYVSDLLEHA